MGTLPNSLSKMAGLATLNLQGNALQGSLPAAWGEPDQFPTLQNM